jgi:hypothetical protein
MPTLVRLLQLMRSGPRPQRAQAWIGVVCIAAAFIWLIINLWKIIITLAVAGLGAWLVGRALRPPPRSS